LIKKRKNKKKEFYEINECLIDKKKKNIYYKMNYTDKVTNIIDNLEFTDKQNKEIIKNRFVDEVNYYEKKRNKTGSYYNVFRFIVTTGSILLPAILSIGQMDPNKLPKNFDQITYWSSWTISLMVTISNGFLQLFSLDKNYFNYSLVVEQLKTEGWQYFGLSGKYEDFDEHDIDSYKMFCKAIETIKRKQVELEFSSGKGDTKKKKGKFDFSKEFNKFKNDNQESLLKNVDVNTSNLGNLNMNQIDLLLNLTNQEPSETINLKEKTEDVLKDSLNELKNINVKNDSGNLKPDKPDIQEVVSEVKDLLT
jgi:hypothetical protein